MQQLTARDCREWKMSAIDPHDRHTWMDGWMDILFIDAQPYKGI